jgi:nucleoside-diphosphate-sugar epimerase
MGFVDVTDVAKCMIALMNSDIHSERFIINAENRDYKNLTAEIAQCFDMKPPAILAKPWMIELAWRGAAFWGVVTGSAPAIDKTSAQAASINRNFDNGKIKKAIGIEFKPVSESIKEVCTALTAK